MELPLTTADWAATEVRFRKNFAAMPREEWNDDTIPFHEFMQLGDDDRIGKIPFIWTLESDKTLKRMRCSNEMVILADDRLMFWHQLKEMAGLDVPETVHDTVSWEMEAEFEKKLAALKAEYEAKFADLKTNYPKAVARRMAEGLLRLGDGQMTVADLLTRAESTSGLVPIGPMDGMEAAGGGVATATGVATEEAPSENGAGAAVATAPAAPAVAEDEDEESLGMEPWIETLRCTSCNECTNINPRLFAYDDNKQAYIKDVHSGTFAQIVQAAERCPAGIIHPGDPVNPREKDLEKWIKRAEPFN
jgi:pyruvate-ferredoxin/flavodoxin oxidoreductase